MWYGQMSHSSLYFQQVAKYICDTHKKNSTDLNGWILQWGGEVALLCCERHFVLSLWVHLFPWREKSLQANTKLFWLLTFVLWCNISILIGVVASKPTYNVTANVTAYIGYEALPNGLMSMQSMCRGLIRSQTSYERWKCGVLERALDHRQNNNGGNILWKKGAQVQTPVQFQRFVESMLSSV